MSVFGKPKAKSVAGKKGAKAPKPKAEKATSRTKAAPKQRADPEAEALDESIANLKSSIAKAEAEKRDNSYAFLSLALTV